MTVDEINKKLIDYYGKFETGEPNWRLVWSEDQYEKRHGEYEDRTPEGILIRRVTEWREVPKYRQWIPKKWVLETLVVVPVGTMELTTKTSFEPIYAFPYVNGRVLIPAWPAVKLLVESILERVGIDQVGARYKDPESNPKEAVEIQKERIEAIEQSLFGGETELADALARGDAIGFTTSKEFKSGTKEIANE